MKKVLILSAALLAGCQTLPPVVKQEFPEVPAALLVACPDLQLVEPGTTKLSTVLSVVKDNYSQYAICKAEVDNWIIWYNKQKDVFNSVK